MPAKTIKTPGYPNFTISDPLDQEKELLKAISEIKKADRLCEFAHMRIEAVRRILKNVPREQAKEFVERLDVSTECLSDSRFKLGDANHQIEKILIDVSSL
jgi:hypothetical protein